MTLAAFSVLTVHFRELGHSFPNESGGSLMDRAESSRHAQSSQAGLAYQPMRPGMGPHIDKAMSVDMLCPAILKFKLRQLLSRPHPH